MILCDHWWHRVRNNPFPLTFIPATADDNLWLGVWAVAWWKGTFELFIFPITCDNHTSTLHVSRVCVCLWVRTTERHSLLSLITHAVISSKPPFTAAQMKGFPLSQSSFFVSMALWFCQNPGGNERVGGWELRGGRKKINDPLPPPHPNTHSSPTTAAE